MKAILKETKELRNWIQGGYDRESSILIDDEYINDEFGDIPSDEEVIAEMRKSFEEKTESGGYYVSNGIISSTNCNPSIKELHEIYGDDFDNLLNNIIRIEY